MLKNTEKINRYGIKKFSVGVVSVTVATGLLISGVADSVQTAVTGHNHMRIAKADDAKLTGNIVFTDTNTNSKEFTVTGNSRVLNLNINYSVSGDSVVTDGYLVYSVKKQLVPNKPTFGTSEFVESTTDVSTNDEWKFKIKLKPMAGGSTGQLIVTQNAGFAILNSPGPGDHIEPTVTLMRGDTETATVKADATFQYTSDGLYRENDTREKDVKNYINNETQRKSVLGVATANKDGMKPSNATFTVPFINFDILYFANYTFGTTYNGATRLTSYDYDISGLPEFLELDSSSANSEANQYWSLENGVLKLRVPEGKALTYNNINKGGPKLKVKDGYFNSENIKPLLASNGGQNYKLTYDFTGTRPDGTTFHQQLTDSIGFTLSIADEIAPGPVTFDVSTTNNQRIFSNQSDTDTFTVVKKFSKHEYLGAQDASAYLNYFIPADKSGNYFTKWSLIENGGASYVYTNATGDDIGLTTEETEKPLPSPMVLYGVKNGQAVKLAEFNTVAEGIKGIDIDPSAEYSHLVLQHPHLVDQKTDTTNGIPNPIRIVSKVDVKMGNWSKMASDDSVKEYKNTISVGQSESDSLESAINTAIPTSGATTGRSVAAHKKDLYQLKTDLAPLAHSTSIARTQSVGYALRYNAKEYFKSMLNNVNNNNSGFNLDKKDPNINDVQIMLLANNELNISNFHVPMDNNLLTKFYHYRNPTYANNYTSQMYKAYSAVQPVETIRSYNGTNETAYIFKATDLGLTAADLKGDLINDPAYSYGPVALTFDVNNNGTTTPGTYPLTTYLVWNSDSEMLRGNDPAIKSNIIPGHADGLTASRSENNVTITLADEFFTVLQINKEGSAKEYNSTEVKRGSTVTLTPTVANFKNDPADMKGVIVTIPKKDVATSLTGPLTAKTGYHVEYTTSTADDKTTAEYVTADKITDWSAVTAVKYVFNDDFTLSKGQKFTDEINLKVDENAPYESTSTAQIFTQNASGNWLESNKVTLKTETPGTLVVKYVDEQGNDIKASETTKGLGQYTATRNDNNGIIETNGKKYKFKELKSGSDAETGEYEKGKEKIVTYVYEEVKKGSVVVNYVDKQGNKIKDSKNVATDVDEGSDYNTNTDELKPQTITTDDGKIYKLVPSSTVGNEIGKVAEGTTEVTYVYELQKGNVVVKYEDTEGNEIQSSKDAAKDVDTGTDYNTDTTDLKPQKITTDDGKIYNYVKVKDGSAAESGKVTTEDKVVTYVYELAKGDVVVNYKTADGTTIKPSEKVVDQGNTGDNYDTTSKKETTITTDDGKIYKLVPSSTVGNETGKVAEGTTEVTYVYELQKGNVVVKYEDTKGNEIQSSKDAAKDVDTGTDYNTDTTDLKPQKITTADGKVYNYKQVKDGSAAESGKVTEKTSEVTYVYEEVKSKVTVAYMTESGEYIQAPTDVVSNASIGTEYKTREKRFAGYDFVKMADDSAPATGKVTEKVQNVIYIYKDKPVAKRGNVIVKYVDDKGNTLLDDVKAANNVVVGKDYSTTDLKQDTIEKDGKKYRLVETRGSETGEVTEETITVTYVYKQVGGEVEAKHVIKGTDIELAPTEIIEKDKLVGEEYNVKEPSSDTRITKDGKVYKYVGLKDTSAKVSGEVSENKTTIIFEYEEVKGNIVQHFVDEKGNKSQEDVDTGAKSLDEAVSLTHPEIITKDGKIYKFVSNTTEPTSYTEGTQEVTYTYKEVEKGSVIVNYVDESGKEIADSETDTASTYITDKDGNKVSYDTADKKKATIEKDGKLYDLDETKLPSNAVGELTAGETKVTYVYKEREKGSVVVNYVDENGNVIADSETDTASKYIIDKDGNKVSYDTADKKKATIEKDGKLYDLDETKLPSNAAGDLTAGETKVTYVYKERPKEKGTVVVKYVDANNNEIKESVVDTPESEVGTKYDTTDQKPETITKDGDTYEFVKVKSGSETGEVSKGETIVVYEYKLVVNTSYVDEDGKELSPSEKGTKDKKDISGYEFVKTTTDEKGNTTHIYRKVVPTPKVTTSYVTTDGKAIPGYPTVDGEQPKKDIQGYKFVETTKDEKGNITHVYEVIKKGSVVVKYVDADNQGKEIKVAVTDLADEEVGTTYDTTDNKPTEIKVGDKVYELVGLQSGKETGVVTEGITTVVYAYKLKEEPVTPVAKITTSYVDEQGNTLLPSKEGAQPQENIPGYEFVKTTTDEKGNITHIYKPIVKITTSFVDENGKELSPTVEGDQPKKDISGYEYVRTTTDEKGNITHIYKPVEKTTSYVDEDGNTISPSEKGTKDKKEISGYEYVKTTTDEKGNTTHIYRKIVNPTKKPHTIYTDEDGNELIPREDGTQPKKDIPGYEYVKTVTDKDGNIQHIYRKVKDSNGGGETPKPNPQDNGKSDDSNGKQEESKEPTTPIKQLEQKITKRLASTGETTTTAVGLGLVALVAAEILRRKKKNIK